MDFTSRRLADVIVAIPAGQIDHVSAKELEQALMPLVDEAASARKPVVLDFSGVDYISSMGLRILMLAAKRMRANDAPIAIAALQPAVEEIFEIARFKFILDVAPSVRAALAKMSAPAAAAYDASAA